MKKIYLSALLSTCFSLSLFANGVEIEGIYYLLDEATHTATVTYPNETTPVWRSNPSTYSGSINIPELVTFGNTAYTVTSIGEKAFLGTSLSSISMPNTITSIRNAAFYDHRGITELALPNLQSVENEAFRYCVTLQRVIFPECLQQLGIIVFQRCLGLKEIQFPQSMTSIPPYTLYACTSLEHLDLPPALTNISHECFYACFSLKSISIPETVTSIGTLAFRGNIAMEKFFIPKNVATLGDEIICGNPLDPYTGDCFRVDGVRQTAEMSKMKSVFIDRETPPSCTGSNKSPFMRVLKDNVCLFVPIGAVDAYNAIPAYADHFKGIYEFGAGVVNVMDITDSSALFTWFPYPDVINYHITIKEGNQLFAEYDVNGNGQIVSSQQYAPSVYNQKKDTTNSSTDYFVISLEGLSAGTDYNYTIDGSNASNAPIIYHEEGSFTTLNEGEEGLFDIISDNPRKQAVKLLRDGQIFILRGEKVYTVTGEEVR
ncbi:MAG: leucine-rich repeat domain-containing protein [Paludibacteraceae bacterium]|nr:leucine-rich repeat domain-containing protein [Paludibacteraceae bacterium]